MLTDILRLRGLILTITLSCWPKIYMWSIHFIANYIWCLFSLYNLHILFAKAFSNLKFETKQLRYLNNGGILGLVSKCDLERICYYTSTNTSSELDCMLIIQTHGFLIQNYIQHKKFVWLVLTWFVRHNRNEMWLGDKEIESWH